MTFVFWCCLVALDAVVPLHGTTQTSRADAAFLGNLVKGRVLLLSLKEGMTEKEVNQILDRPSGKIGWSSFAYDADYELGVRVHFNASGKAIGWSAYRFIPN